MNTKISYLYRDADNYKMHNKCVIAGTLTTEQARTIKDSCEMGEYFIPRQVGLPERRFDRYDPAVDHCWFELDEDCFSETVEPPMEYENLSDLNELAEATDGLSKADMEKLGAVVMLAEPKSAAQIKNLAESLDLFDFAPGAHTPEEYGKYMIRQSGHFEYDENLDAFYDYEKYGTERMNAEDGMFTDRGYIAYKGYISMEEVMNGSQSSRMEMGGFSR